MEDAAKKGSVQARYNLGLLEEDYQQHDLAIRHFKLAAAAGHEKSMKCLWKYFPSKLDKAKLEETLRAHKLACDEMDSEERQRWVAHQEALAGDDKHLKLIYSCYYDGLMTAKELKELLKVHGSGDIGRVMGIVLPKLRLARYCNRRDGQAWAWFGPPMDTCTDLT